MIRLIIGGLLVVWSMVPAAAGIAASTEDARSLPMRFEWRREGPAGVCGARCRRWISAIGAITADTPREFEAFAQRENPQGAALVLDSGGGSVLAALSLGRMIRRFDMTTTVGKTVDVPGMEPGETRARISPRADCESMCAFLLLAGARRYVPPEARVLVHQIWLGDKRNDATAATYSAEDVVTIQRDVGRLVLYTAEMGGAPELVETALRIPPWERMRALSADELRRTRLQTVDQLFNDAPPDVTISSAPTSPDPIPVEAINARGWSVLDSGGRTVLVRRHPLTVEGEEIGSFDLIFGCGVTPDAYAVTYVERRRNSVGRRMSDPLKDVSIAVGANSALLRIESSLVTAKPPGLASLARGMIPAAMVSSLAETGSRSLTVETMTRGNAETAIRIGNTGVARNFPRLAAACARR